MQLPLSATAGSPIRNTPRTHGIKAEKRSDANNESPFNPSHLVSSPLPMKYSPRDFHLGF